MFGFRSIRPETSVSGLRFFVLLAAASNRKWLLDFLQLRNSSSANILLQNTKLLKDVESRISVPNLGSILDVEFKRQFLMRDLFRVLFTLKIPEPPFGLSKANSKIFCPRSWLSIILRWNQTQSWMEQSASQVGTKPAAMLLLLCSRIPEPLQDYSIKYPLPLEQLFFLAFLSSAERGCSWPFYEAIYRLFLATLLELNFRRRLGKKFLLDRKIVKNRISSGRNLGDATVRRGLQLTMKSQDFANEKTLN